MYEILHALGAGACPVCDDAPASGRGPALEAALCDGCAAELPGSLIRLERPPEGAEAAFTWADYAGTAGAVLRRGKYGGDTGLLRHLAAWGVGRGVPMAVDAVVPVPTPAARLLLRGFDPTSMLAAPIAAAAGVPLVHALRRGRGAAMASFRPSQRRSAVRGQFSARTAVTGRVLLVDDVMTTGNTLSACVSALHHAGANAVVVLTATASGRLIAAS